MELAGLEPQTEAAVILGPPTRKPSVSIVITNFNYARFLERSVGSALRQDYGLVQIVVVDDCSTDNSAAVIATFGDAITPLMKPANEGHGAAFNSGIAACTGELVLLLDADDYLYPNAVTAVVSALQPQASMYQYRLDLVDRNGQAMEVYPPAETIMEDGDVRPALTVRGRFSTTVTSGLAFPRNVLQKILPMPAEAFRQGGDGYLVTVAPLYGPVVTAPGILGAYCQHGGNHSQFDQALAARARWRLEHDEHRYQALRAHGERQGANVEPEPGLNDIIHLNERIASLVLGPEAHPYKGDRRARIAVHARRALASAPLSAKRRRMLILWWWFVGLAPRKSAAAAIVWTMSAVSRPAFIDRIAKFARRMTRPTQLNFTP